MSDDEKTADRKSGKVGRPPKRGRPTTYTAELAEEICWLVVQGKTMAQIGRMASMPDERTIFRWLARHTEFGQQYAQAREQRHMRQQDRLGELAEDVLEGNLDPKAFREAARQLNWQAEREAAKKYGRNLNLNGNLSVTMELSDLVAEIEGEDAAEEQAETEADDGDSDGES